MSGSQRSRGGREESIDAFMARREREIARRGPDPRVPAYEAYRNSIRTGQDLRLAHPGDLVLYGASLQNPAWPGSELPPEPAAVPDPMPALPGGSDADPPGPDPDPQPSPGSVGQPGFAESFIPVWGSGRAAIADFQEGNYGSAAFNAALAASDLFIAGTLLKAIAKGGRFALLGPIAKEGKRDWKNIRPEMRRLGMIEKNQQGHHWLIPNNGWGKRVPEEIKNHPLNIMPMPDIETHMRIHKSWNKKPKFDWKRRYWHGTPRWSKVATVSVPGHGVEAVEADRRDR